MHNIHKPFHVAVLHNKLNDALELISSALCFLRKKESKHTLFHSAETHKNVGVLKGFVSFWPWVNFLKEVTAKDHIYVKLFQKQSSLKTNKISWLKEAFALTVWKPVPVSDRYHLMCVWPALNPRNQIKLRPVTP